jgi:hypothetical protein
MTTLIPKFQQTGTGAVNRAINLKLAESVSILDFGADPTGVADSSAAIQAAHDSLPASGGAVFAPKGTYKIGSTLNFSKKIHFFGEGYSESEAVAAPTRLVKTVGFSGVGINVTGNAAILENFEINGGTQYGTDGIVIDANRVVLRQVSSFSHGQDGVRIGRTTSAGGNSNIWRLDQVVCRDNARDGVNVDSLGQNANAGLATTLTLSNNARCGLYLNACAANSFVNVHAETNGIYGWAIDPLSNANIFFGGDPEGNGTRDIDIQIPTFGSNVFVAPNVNIANVSDLDPLTSWFGYQKIKSPGIQGTWTPALGSVSGESTAPTYDLQSGTWVRVGNLVTVLYRIILTNKGTGWVAPEVYLKGLPFTSVAGNPGTAETVQLFGSLTTSLISMGLATNAGTKTAYLTKQTAASINNGTQLVYTDISDTTTIKGSFSYITSEA